MKLGDVIGNYGFGNQVPMSLCERQQWDASVYLCARAAQLGICRYECYPTVAAWACLVWVCGTDNLRATEVMEWTIGDMICRLKEECNSRLLKGNKK